MANRSQNLVALLVVTIVVLIITSRRGILGAWYRNQGYLDLTSSPLIQWPALNCLEDVSSEAVNNNRARVERSETAFQRALGLTPDDLSATIGLGLIDCLNGTSPVSNRWQSLANERGADDARAQFHLALYYLATQDYSRAQEPLTLSGSMGSRFLQDRGQTAIHLNQSEAALKWFELAAVVDPSSEMVEALANLYLRLDRRAEAAQAWQIILDQAQPQEAEHWWARGEIAKLSGDLAAAQEAFQRAAELAEDPYRYYEKLGIAARDAGEFEKALASFKLAIQSRPDYQYAYLYAGDMAASLGRIDDALGYYSKAGQIAPQSALPDLRSTAAEIERKDFSNAVHYLEASRLKDPQNAQVFYYQALIEDARGNRAAAIEQMRMAVDRSPRSTSWLYLLGMWYEESGQLSPAIQIYKQILTIDPHHAGAAARLKQVEQNDF